MNDPTITILQPGDEAALEAFLWPRVETSMFLLGNMRSAGLADNGRYHQGTYAAAWENGRIVGVVGHFWNQNLLVQAPEHIDLLWQTAVVHSGRGIRGLLGPNEQVGAVLQALALDDAVIQADEPEKLYRLHLGDLVVPPALAGGCRKARRASQSDLDTLVAWRVAYEIELLEEPDTPSLWQRAHASLTRYVERQLTWVLADQGQLVSMTSFNAILDDVVQVGGVYTPPERRGQGYGRSVVAASLLDARTEGASLSILFTGEENIPAQKAYEALGYEHIGDYRITLLKTAVNHPLSFNKQFTDEIL